MNKNVELSNKAYEAINEELIQCLDAIKQSDGFGCKADKKLWQEIADEFEIDWDEYQEVPVTGEEYENYEALDMNDETGYPGVSNPRGFKIDDIE